MKTAIIALLLSALSFSAWAETPTDYEYNFKQKIEDYTFTQRSREGTWHIEVGTDVKDINVMYRYADLNGTIENRAKFTHKLFAYGPISLSHRIEYRHFDNKESHWRYRFILGGKYPLGSNTEAWFKIQPRLAFKDAGTQFDSRDQLGLNFKFKNIKVGPFVERASKKDIGNVNNYVAGINFSAKL